MNPPDPTRPLPGGRPKPLAGKVIKVEAIVELALARPREERAAYVAEAAAGDESLSAQAMLLLASAEGAWNLIVDEPLSPEVEEELARLKPEEAGECIGRYKLREQLGEGGFGTVWVADQEEPVRRRVALKIIKLGMDTKDVIARFEQERQALAMMDHPNIAKVFDAGATEWGRPFFVMEMVRGVRITDYCDQENLPTQERLKLFLSVCHAVQHAHQKGIIHRDLKPSNILVTLHDGVPVPKVIDFGVAKATQGRLTDLTIYTQFQQMIGTPLYMSPEQAEMSGLDVDTRSDIYALGVLLYELLTGRTPITPDTLGRMGMDEIRRIIREEDAPRPSIAVHTMPLEGRSRVAHRHRTQPPKLISQLRGDLDCIVMKALEKDRTHRYETANGLAMDIERHLAHEPVLARPTSQFYRLRRSVRRNKAVFLSLVTVFLVVLLGGTVATWQALLAQRTLKRLQATAPTFSDLSEKLGREEKFTEAIEKIGFALTLDPNNADYITRRADLLQATQRLSEAAELYRNVLTIRDDSHARTNLALCEKVLERDGPSNPLSWESQNELVTSLLRQERFFDAAPLCKLIGRESETHLLRIKERLRHFANLPGWDWNARLQLTKNGTYSLNLGVLPIKELPKLNDLPVTELVLSETDVSDLEGLRGMQLAVLHLDATRVADIGPLTGMPLTTLTIEHTRVSDLTPLKGAPLERLQIYNTPISDLAPLRGMPLKHLQAASTPIIDLSPLSGMPLEWLDANRIPAIDFSPLANTRLQTLVLSGDRMTDLQFVRALPLKSLYLYECNEITDFRPLAECRTLEELGLPTTNRDLSFLKALPALKKIGFDFEGPLIPPGVFWERRDRAIATRKAAYAALSRMGFADATSRVMFRTDGKVDVDLAGLPVADFTPLKALPIHTLTLFQATITDLNHLVDLDVEDLQLHFSQHIADLTPLSRFKNLNSLSLRNSVITDLGALRGVRLKRLDLTETAVTDLSPLRGMPLEHLHFARTKVRDASPLLDCPTLRHIEFSTTVDNVEVLRALPALEYLSSNWDHATSRPAQTAKEFWLEYDFLHKPPDDSSRLEAIGFSGTASEVVDLWTNGRKVEALTAYGKFRETPRSGELLAEVHKYFAKADWTVTWFPFKGDANSDPEGWRGGAKGQAAVTLNIPMLYFSYGMTGPQRAGIHPDLTRRGPGPRDFGMVAYGQLLLPRGRWRFALRSDDGSRLIVNGTPLIEHWSHHDAATKTADFEQEDSAPLDIVVEHFQEDGWAELKLTVEPIGSEGIREGSPPGELHAMEKELNDALSSFGLERDDRRGRVTVRSDGRFDLNLGHLPISDLAPLRALSLRRLDIIGTNVSDLRPLAGTSIQLLWCGNTKSLSDVSPLAGCLALEELAIFGTAVSDLSPLKAPKLKRLWIAATPVADLSSLRDLPVLEAVFFSKTPVTDIRPLLDCKSLRQVELSTFVENVEVLREHPGLTHISYGFDHRNARPDKTVAEFWAEFDASGK